MLVAATGDIHHPMYTDQLLDSLRTLETNPDLFLVAGDVLRPGDVSDYQVVISSIMEYLSCPIVATFGNTEFQEDRKLIRHQNPGVTFLDDESTHLTIQNQDLLIVGSTGSLDRPTSWQKRNIPFINEIYRARVETVSKLLSEEADLKILLTHYAPTYLTLKGENPSSFPWLGSRRYERVIRENRPDVVVHAHAHNGTAKASLNGIPVFNVSLPLNGRVVLIVLSARRESESQPSHHPHLY